jgi:6,7-dimethyl-8-ribityllumazine synthase
MAGPGLFDSLESATCKLAGLEEVRGGHDAAGMTFGLAVARFHTELTGALAQEIVCGLEEAGAARADLDVVWVPGTFELPVALRLMARRKEYDALIAVGAVIEGRTSHADVIVAAVARALVELAGELVLPMLDGVVGAPTYELALERCKPGPNCRGAYLAEAAIEMGTVAQRLKGEGAHG